MNGFENLYCPLLLTPGTDGIFLREINAADELVIEDSSTKTLVTFLDRLMKDLENANKITASQIVTADRDRIVAKLYISLFGSKIESTVECNRCYEKFDLNFSLKDLLNHYAFQRTSINENGGYELEPGLCFRLPTGADEIFVSSSNKINSEKVLLERCLIEGSSDNINDKIHRKMNEIAPLLNTELEARCPECRHSQMVSFDIQSYFLTSLKQEKTILIKELHLLALHYHWGHHEILQIPRKLRKQLTNYLQSTY